MDRVTRIMVNKRYFPNRGTARDVGGMISASSRKKTVSDSRIEMHRVTWKVSRLYFGETNDTNGRYFNKPFLLSRMADRTPELSKRICRHRE